MRGVMGDHVEHVEPGAAVVAEVVVVGPAHLCHNVTGAVVLREVDQPVVTVSIAVADEERGVVPATAVSNQGSLKTARQEGPPTLSRSTVLVTRESLTRLRY